MRSAAGKLLVAVLLLAGLIYAAAEVPKANSEVLADPRMLSDMFVEIAEAVGPSVVTINSRTTVVARAPSYPDMGGPFMFDPWGDFFQMPREQEYTMEGVGSGVIVSSDGMILTNHHVVGEADRLEVILQSGQRYSGELVGTDPETDLAVIRIDASDLPVISLGDSDRLRVGQWILAVGSPFALSQTVTQGIVSYIGRSDVGLADYENYIQTDAAINPGNSGGALVDLDGRLVGINTAIASRNGGYQGIGFAIPVNSAIRVMNDLLEYGYVRRGWLGVTIQELTPGLQEHFGLEPDDGGVLVSQVLEDTPAGMFGVTRGDVILSINGESFENVTVFRNMIADLEPESSIDLGILRDGRLMELEVVLGERAPSQEVISTQQQPQESFGWTLEELDPETARALGDPDLQGVLVTGVSPDGRAAGVGIAAGDVILEIDGFEVDSPEEVRRLLASDDDFLILVWRQGRAVYFVL